MSNVDVIRALFPEIVRRMTQAVNLPIIDISKNRELKGVSITTTKKDTNDLAQANTNFITIDYK